MSSTLPKKPISPCTSSELLDYLVSINHKQVEVYKSYFNGLFRSSYSITHCGGNLFDMFVSIEDRWVTTKRKKFIGFHGDEEHIWHFWE